MRNNYTVAGLTINVGAVLDDNGKRLTSTGNVVINGTFGVNGGGGDLRMETSGTTISGNGNIDDARLEIDGNITLAAGSTLNFMNGADIRVGNNAIATFTIDGAITAVGIQAGQTILKVDDKNTSTVIINGSIDAPTSDIEIQQNGTIQNNGSVSIAFLDGNGDTNVTWTQGANSTLSLSEPAQGWNNGTFDASATGNTVNFNGTATPFSPATYYNIGGVGVACPHPAGIAVLGSTPCVTFPTVTSINTASANPTAPASTVSWTITFSASVTGVDAADFALVLGGGVSGASITGVTDGGTTWTVTANTGSGTGTLGLNLVDDDSIVDASARKLGDTGAGNGNFTGQVYTVAAPMTCITDNFSAGLDANLWKVLTIQGPFTPQVVNLGGGDSRLRLTDTGGNEATFAQLKRTFPGAGNKIVLEIDYFAYGGSGADGIAVTFSDSAISSSTGGFGGSLGYARNGANDGFGGGWLGIGLDEYGNFPNPTEGRTGYPAGWVAPAPANKAAGFYKTNVSIRGSGSGQIGYSLLANTGVLATPVAPAGGAAGATPYRYRLTIDHSNGVNAWVTVERDITATGTAYQTLVPTFDVKAANSGQVAVPPSWLISFTASTGGATNFHEFKQVKVCANTIAGGGPHHLEIQHPDGTGVTCTPSTLTIKACADNLIPCTPYTGGVNGTLSASGAPTVNWDGTTGGAAGADFVIPAGSSTVTKNVQVTTVGNTVLDAVTVPAASNPTSCNFGAPTCTFTATDSALLVSAPDHLADSVSALTIQAVKAAPGNPLLCIPGMTGTKTVNLKCAYSNPATGSQSVRIAGTALNAGNAPAAACDAGGASVTLTFNGSGIATPTLQYADVGQMNVSASYTGLPGTIDAGLSMTGSGSFVAAPASFAFSGITAGPIKAGNDFSATITALNAAGNVTPNFGKETAAEGVTLTSMLVTPLGGNNPALANGAVAGSAFINGIATVNNFSWGEVGSITLDAALSNGNYLGSGLTATGTSATVGAFIPDHFETVVLTSGGLPMNCPDGPSCPVSRDVKDGFVYSGQQFSTRVTALNLAGATTTNYGSSFGLSREVTLSAWDAVGSTATQNPGGGSLANYTIAATAFSAGMATAVLPSYGFAGATVPTDIYLRGRDTDGASSLRAGAPLTSLEAGVRVANGRIKISNAYGSELLPLTLTVTTQYFAGAASGWVTSLTDSMTNLTLAATYPVGAGTTAASFVAHTDIACLPYVNGNVCKGTAVINLAKPSNGSGVATISPGAAAYMPVTNGTATFGVYRGNNEFIYQREAY
jgi:MSHA biogenesis protein MshQ